MVTANHEGKSSVNILKENDNYLFKINFGQMAILFNKQGRTQNKPNIIRFITAK